MELYQLKAFVAVAEHGNMTRAAESLYTSQPAVSAQIKSLEQSFGVQLFHRSAAGMTLTDQAKALLDQARITLAQARTTEDLARHLRGNPSRSLRIGINDAGPRLRVDALTRALLADQPDLSISFDQGTSGSVLAGIRRFDLDVGFFEGPTNDSAIAYTSLGQVELCIVMPNGWAKRMAKSSDWSSLSDVPWVFTRPDCSYHAELARLSERHGFKPNKQFRLDHSSVSLELVREGLAVSMVGVEFARPYVEAGELTIWPHYQGSIPMSAINLKQRHDEPAIVAFREAVARVFADAEIIA
jgi:DNA-binding transcriptional LysR family regulator